MYIQVQVNKEEECFDLVDMDSDQSHDGDGAKEKIASVYNGQHASAIQEALNQGRTREEQRYHFCAARMDRSFTPQWYIHGTISLPDNSEAAYNMAHRRISKLFGDSVNPNSVIVISLSKI